MRIEYKTGLRRTVRDSTARRLIRVGIAREVRVSGSNTYQTRDLRATRVVVDDGLDSLDASALRKIAEDRGVKVHHKAGADKIRAALRETK